MLAIQEYAINEAPDELALRWSISAPPYSGTGYFYGDPTDFDAALKPLMDRLPANATLTKSEFGFWTLDTYVAPGINLPDGGSSPGRSMYTQALTLTTENPFTYDLAYTLKSGFLDLWGGVSSQISNTDTSHAHGNNLWLNRWEANAPNAALGFPADGVSYMKSLMLPFEEELQAAGIPLRGFANYRDTALTEAEWSQRLYGEENFKRLKKIKAAVDPEGLFTSNDQSIPLP